MVWHLLKKVKWSFITHEILGVLGVDDGENIKLGRTEMGMAWQNRNGCGLAEQKWVPFRKMGSLITPRTSIPEMKFTLFKIIDIFIIYFVIIINLIITNNVKTRNDIHATISQHSLYLIRTQMCGMDKLLTKQTCKDSCNRIYTALWNLELVTLPLLQPTAVCSRSFDINWRPL